MQDATQFEIIMRTIWGDDNPDPGFIIRSIVARLRGSQCCNHENACEVLSLTYPKAKCEPRLNEPFDQFDITRLIFDVTFEDGSRCLIAADKYGIGHSVESFGEDRTAKITAES